jgi:acetyl-CoA acetyltransferase
VVSGANSHGALIVGCGQAPYSRHPPASTTTLSVLAEAAWNALRSAGMDAAELDGLAVSSFSLEPDHAVDLAWRMGLHLRWLMQDTNGGAGGVNMLQHAARAVESGDARAVLVLAGDHVSRAAFRYLVDNYNSATRDHLAPLPFGGPNSLFAMLTRRHADANGLERGDYGALVVTQRQWARDNPGAVYRRPLTLGEYLAARLVADPLCLYDCVPVVTGADALIVRAARAGDHDRPVAVRGAELRFNYDDQQGDGLRTGLAAAADTLWRTTGAGPGDMDITMVYDDYPAMVLIQLADLGYVSRGDLHGLIHDEIASRRLALNTSGGQLSAGQAGAAGGLHGIVEAVRQLRGEAGPRQVANARLALAAGYGMVCYRYGACAGAVVLERISPTRHRASR